MAFDAGVANWIPNWSEDATTISVPIATFPEMTAAEADATTGDIRKVMFAIMEQLWARWNAIAAADRPAKMLMYRNSSVNDATGVTTKTFTLVFSTAVATQDVVAE